MSSTPPEQILLAAKTLLDAGEAVIAEFMGDDEDRAPEWSYALAVEALQTARLPNPPADPSSFEFYAPVAGGAGGEIGSMLLQACPDVRKWAQCDPKLATEPNGPSLNEAIETEANRILEAKLPDVAGLLTRLAWYEREAFLLGFWLFVSGTFGEER